MTQWKTDNSDPFKRASRLYQTKDQCFREFWTLGKHASNNVYSYRLESQFNDTTYAEVPAITKQISPSLCQPHKSKFKMSRLENNNAWSGPIGDGMGRSVARSPDESQTFILPCQIHVPVTQHTLRLDGSLKVQTTWLKASGTKGVTQGSRGVAEWWRKVK